MRCFCTLNAVPCFNYIFIVRLNPTFIYCAGMILLFFHKTYCSSWFQIFAAHTMLLPLTQECNTPKIGTAPFNPYKIGLSKKKRNVCPQLFFPFQALFCVLLGYKRQVINLSGCTSLSLTSHGGAPFACKDLFALIIGYGL